LALLYISRFIFRTLPSFIGGKMSYRHSVNINIQAFLQGLIIVTLQLGIHELSREGWTSLSGVYVMLMYIIGQTKILFLLGRYPEF